MRAGPPHYPPGARFVWNVEVLWAADLYLRRLNEPQRAEFLDAVKQGQVALNGMYLNELTGLCRPEELMRLFRYATQLGRADRRARRLGDDHRRAGLHLGHGHGHGPGGHPVLLHGARTTSTASATILVQWENKPFWWVGPDGRSQVLVWIPVLGLRDVARLSGDVAAAGRATSATGLKRRGYPYDIAYVRWSGHGDNAVPDPAICEFVKDWNAQVRLAAVRHLLDERGLPRLRADATATSCPGCAATGRPTGRTAPARRALETAMNRASSDRLAQAETLWAMLKPGRLSRRRHSRTPGTTCCSTPSTPGAPGAASASRSASETRDQWEIKQCYARRRRHRSRATCSRARWR